MVLARLRSSVSTQAICFYWQHRPDVPSRSSLLLLFLPAGVTYIRSLTKTELKQQGLAPFTETVWYGCFDYHSGTQLARCESFELLQAFIKQYGYQLLEVDDI